MEITIPVKIRLTESEWARLRDSLREAGNHTIWNKIVSDWETLYANNEQGNSSSRYRPDHTEPEKPQ
jgi:hypothetical protein